MRCDYITFDARNGLLHKLATRFHVMRCAKCREQEAELTKLSQEISRLRDEPIPPTLSEKIIADAMTAAADTRSRASSQTTVAERKGNSRRLRAVGVFAAIVIVVGLWALPRGMGNYALVNVAHAMSNVKSVHFAGYTIDSESGKRMKIEGWLKGPNKYRMIEEGIQDQAIDGKKAITVKLSGPETEALIQPSDNVKPEVSISMFRNEAALDFFLKGTGVRIRRVRNTTLHGVEVKVTELSGRGGRMLVYADADTNLLVRFEEFFGGKLSCLFEKFDYEKSLPDSVFSPQIPKGIPVVDTTAPISPEKARWREDQELTLEGNKVEHVTFRAPDGEIVHGVNTSWVGPRIPLIDVSVSEPTDAPYHPGFRFKLLKPWKEKFDDLYVYYLPDKNVYRVLGMARVLGPNGFSRVVEDGDIRLPGKPQIYETLLKNGEPGAFCSFGRDKTSYATFDPYRFLNVGTGPLTVLWDKSREIFVIRGTAKLLPTEKVYANETLRLDMTEGAEPLVSVRNPDYNGLPSAEEQVAREQLDILQRYAALVKYHPMGGAPYRTINGAGAEYYSEWDSMAGPDATGFLIKQYNRAVPYIFTVKSRREYYVIGRAKVHKRGHRDQIVKNGIVGFNCKVISTEK